MSTAAKRQVIETGYSPRPLQANLHKLVKRFNVVVCHRRFGKTVWAINHMLDRGLKNPLKNPQYAYLAPFFGQAKRVAWDYLKMYTANIPGAIVNEADLRVDIPRPGISDRVRFMLLGADNPMALKGIYLDGVILDEYGEMNPSAWREVIRPTLSDRIGWAIFLGTPKGQNHFYEVWETAVAEGNLDKDSWHRAMFKASETGIIPESELRSARSSMTEEEYEQEYECSFNAGLMGAYFAKELTAAEKDGRIGKFPYDPMLPVDTYWDLGQNDLAAVWMIQTQRGMHRAIDYYEISGADVPTVVAELKRRPYVYGDWVLPHDARQKNFATGKSAEMVFYSLGIRPIKIVPRCQHKRDSINAARMIFGKVQFDEEKCRRGLKALANYQRKWDPKNNVFQDNPLHNWASNGADAFQQFALGVREDTGSVIGGRHYDGRTPLQAETDYDPFD